MNRDELLEYCQRNGIELTEDLLQSALMCNSEACILAIIWLQSYFSDIGKFASN